MKKLFLLFILMIFNSFAVASAELKLYVKIKNNDVCVYTNDLESKYYEGRIYLYMGEVYSDQAYKSSYMATYHKINIPKNYNDCIAIRSSNFKKNTPYDINLDMNKAYSQRICVSKTNDKVELMNVINGYTCGTEKYNYSGEINESFFGRLMIWFKSLFH